MSLVDFVERTPFSNVREKHGAFDDVFHAQSAPGNLTAAQMREDIAAFRTGFMARDNSFTAQARAQAESRLGTLDAAVDRLTPAAFELELSRIVALADNGHTNLIGVIRAQHYNRVPIPHPDTRPDLAKPVLFWTPVLAPGNMALYNGAMFPEWNGSALITGLGSRSLARITFDGKGGAAPAERWFLGSEIRDVAVGPDGTVWLLVNEARGALVRVTPTLR